MSDAPADVVFRDHLGDEGWARIRMLGTVVVFEAGATVARRGDPPRWLFVVESGSMIIVDPRTSPETVLATRGAGHVLGEMSYVDGRPVSAEVRAEEPTSCLRLDAQRLPEQLRADPRLDALFHRALAATLGSRIRAVTTSAVTGGLAPRTRERTGADGPTGEVELDQRLSAALRDGAERERIVRLAGDHATVGTSEVCEVRLDGPGVAPVHAELVRADGGWRIVSVSDRVVVVDGLAVASAPVRSGGEIRIGRTLARLHGDALHLSPTHRPFALHVGGVERTLRGRRLLTDVGFTVLSGEVVALVGPSGSGKSTLLGALSGSAPADRGRVRLGNVDLRELVDRVPALVAEVPQDDLVLPELTVEESLRYAARLRMPRAPADAREGRVNRVLVALGLDPVRSSPIGDPSARGISGGQRKRVNIAQELLTDATRVLFLDEPTSGLDPRSAEEIARLARRLADEGRIVFLVTHDLSEGVLSQVDHLALVAGGHLAWFGPVADALVHFGVRTPARIFDCLADHPPSTWAQRYAGSPSASTWVSRRVRVADERLPEPPADTAGDPPSWLGQVRTLAARAALVKSRDRTALGVLGFQPLLVGAVVLGVFPEPTAGLVFLLVLASFWFGLSAAVRELIGDRVLWRRERRLGVSASAWVLAKAGVLALAVAAQCAVAVGIAWLGVDLAAVGYRPVPLFGAALLTAWAGLALGLLVSAAWRRPDAAVGTIVLLLVPQIAFVGMLTPLDQLGPVGRAVSWAMPLRYALHLALVTGDRLRYLGHGTWNERTVSGELYGLGLRPPGEGALGLPPAVLVGVLVGVTVTALLGAVKVLDADGRPARG